MRLEIPSLILSMINGLGAINRLRYKNKFLSNFDTFAKFKKFVKYNEIKKNPKNLLDKKKYMEIFHLKELKYDIYTIYKFATEDVLAEIYKKHYNPSHIYYNMKRYRHHTTITGYHVNMWCSGKYYYQKNVEHFFDRFLTIFKQGVEGWHNAKTFAEDKPYCLVKFYPTRIGYENKVYRYILPDESYNIGDLVVVDYGKTARIDKIDFSPFEHKDFKMVERKATLEECSKADNDEKKYKAYLLRQEQDNNRIMLKRKQEEKEHNRFLETYFTCCYIDNDKYYVVDDTPINVGDYIVIDKGKLEKVINIEIQQGQDIISFLNKPIFTARKASEEEIEYMKYDEKKYLAAIKKYKYCKVVYLGKNKKQYNYFLENDDIRVGDIAIAPNNGLVEIKEILTANKYLLPEIMNTKPINCKATQEQINKHKKA